MPQDAFTMRIAADELDALLRNGRVNRISQPNADEVIMDIYAGGNFRIVVSANARTARVCTTGLEKQNPKTAPGFCMLLRKHLSGAVIKSVKNPGFERITLIEFEVKNDFLESETRTLVCELMGKYSNVILLSGDKILGTLRPSFGDINVPRVLMTGMAYTPPPKQDKVEITEKTRVLGGFCSFDGKIADFVSRTIKGVSDKTAKEAAYAFSGDAEAKTDAAKAEEFYAFLSDFLLKPRPKPCTDSGDFYAFDYKLTGTQKSFFPSLLEAEQAFFDTADTEREMRAASGALAEKLKKHIKKLNKKLQIINEKLVSAQDAETNRIKGELLTAFQYAVQPAAKSCVLDNYYDGTKIEISLDPDLSAIKNAQAYFKKYSKQKKTVQAALPQKAETEAELAYADDLAAELESCKNVKDCEFVAEEMRAAGLLKGGASGKKKEAPSRPKTFVLGDFYIKVGRNNIQNDALTAGAKREDLWLHTKGFHSAHVIVETEGRAVPDSVLLAAAEICAYHSKAKSGDKVPVDYCLKKFVKKPPKSKPGAAIYTDFKTVLVTPSAHDELSVKQ